MKNLTRAQRKKAQKQFAVGDNVTWGLARTSHRVVEVNARGLIVDVTSCKETDKNIDLWATKQPDGRFFMLVLYDSNVQHGASCRFREHGTCAGPPYHVDDQGNKRT